MNDRQMGQKIRRLWRLSATQGLILLLLLGATGIQFGCYPNDELSVTDLDLVATFYDSATNFSTKHSYALADSLIELAAAGQPGGTINRQYQQQILDLINTNMASLGFVKVDNPLQADVVMTPYVTTTTWVGGDCYPGYWAYYWCIPYYYTFKTSTLIIDMADPSQAPTNGNRVFTVWFAGIRGLSEGSSASISARLTTNINQAFAQSHYLGAGKLSKLVDMKGGM
jgi:hypothetical protein